MEAQKNRDHFFDIIRGILMFAVVFLHSKSGVDYIRTSLEWNYFYWFSLKELLICPVALFIFISGYYNAKYKMADVQSFLRKRIPKMVIPYIFWSTVYILAINLFVNKSIPLMQDIVIHFLTGDISAHLYFMVVLFQLTLISPFICEHDDKKWCGFVCIAVSVIWLILIYIYQINVKKQLPYREVYFFGWLVFYYFGIMYKENEESITNKIQSFPTAVYFLIYLVTYAISLIESFILKRLLSIPLNASMSFFKLSSYLYTIATILLIIKIKVVISKKNEKLIEQRKPHSLSNIIRLIGKNSNKIYYMHVLVLLLVSKVLDMLTIINNLLPVYHIVLVTLTMTVSLIGSLLINKITNIEKKAS